MSRQRLSFVLARHGESVANRDGWLAGHQDVSLTFKGEQQAVELARAVQRVGLVVSSDLMRARSTADAVAGFHGVAVVYSTALRERDFGEWTGRRKRDLDQHQRDVLTRLDGRPPGGESLRDVAYRVVQWLLKVEKGGREPILVVTHSGVCRGLVALSASGPSARNGGQTIANGACVPMELDSAVLLGLEDGPTP